MYLILSLLLVGFILYQHSYYIVGVPSMTIWRGLATIWRIPFNQLAEYDREFLKGKKMLQTPFRSSWSVLVSSCEGLKQIFEDTATFPKMIAADHYPQSAYAKFMGVNVLDSNHLQWRRHRKVVSPPFKQQFQPGAFFNLAQQLTSHLEDQPGSVSIYEWIQKLTIDALGVALLGIEFESLKGADSKFISAYNRFIDGFITPLYLVCPLLDTPLNPFRRSIYKDIQFVEDYLNNLITERKSDIKQQPTTSRQDLLSLMIQASDEDNFTDKELRDNIMVFFLAGQNTTSASLSFALYLLARYPDAQEKAREEAIRVLGPDPSVSPTTDQLHQLDYILAVIKETLRLYSPVAILPERIAARDVTIDGKSIKEGTAVFPYLYQMHRDPDYFDRPDDFSPERFLDNKLNTSTYAPFGGGTRSCIGKGFTLTEQKVVLATLLRSFQIGLPEEGPDTLTLGLSTLLAPDGLKLTFSPLPPPSL